MTSKNYDWDAIGADLKAGMSVTDVCIKHGVPKYMLSSRFAISNRKQSDLIYKIIAEILHTDDGDTEIANRIGATKQYVHQIRAKCKYYRLCDGKRNGD